MAISSKDIQLMKQVAAYFESTRKIDNPNAKYKPKREDSRSVSGTAKHFNLSVVKTTKMLVTMGVYSTPMTEKCKKLRDQGKSLKEIAEELGVSTATVSSNLPYEDLFYGSDEVSEHTAAMRGYRAYEKAQTERAKARAEEATSTSKATVVTNSSNGAGDAEQGKAGTQSGKAETQGTGSQGTSDISKEIGSYVLPSNMVRLNVALDWVESENVRKVLKEYGGVKRGETITRDILVPKAMPLRALHYTLQRAFGFQDGHVHNFELYSEDLKAVTGNRMDNLSNLRGVIFTMGGGTADAPEYHGGSFKKWLKRQYTAPYYYYGDELWRFHGDGYENMDDLRYLGLDTEYYLLTQVHPEGCCRYLERSVTADEFERWLGTPGTEENTGDEGVSGAASGAAEKGSVDESRFVKWAGRSFDDWHLEWCDGDDEEALTYERMRLGDMSIDAGLLSLKYRPTEIIERLRIGDVLALAGDYLPYDWEGNQIHSVVGLKRPQVITKDQIEKALDEEKEIRPKPFTDVLRYVYDFGDNWHFRITGSKGCSDLIENKVITKAALDRAIAKVTKEKHPVLLTRDGDMLIEDSGNVTGFCKFLLNVNISQDDVVEEENDYMDPKSFYEPLSDEDVERMQSSLLDWAVMQGWHRNDTSDINLL